MPELPEVETIKRELQKVLHGKTITGVDILWPKVISPTFVNTFRKIVIGQKIKKLERRAKMLLVYLTEQNDKATLCLVIHLKMTGQLIFVPLQKGGQAKNRKIITGGHPTPDIQIPGKHTRLFFTFTDGSKLYFNDLRKFGWVKILDDKLKNHLLTKIGLEPLSKTFTMVNLKKILERYPNRTVKQVLLDQQLIAGLGNIYADESAFLSSLLPMRKTKTLKEKEIVNLHKNIIAILKFAISKKGTSSRNYLRSNGQKGGFVPYLKVYGPTGEPCKKCKAPIKKTRHAGRGTHFCPTCQK